MPQFHRFLQEIEACYAENIPERISSVMTEYLSGPTMPSMLDSILSDATARSFLSRYSYGHQNGFDKMMLYISPDFGWKARLHIWWNKEAETASRYDIHNHAWNYYSYVVLGHLTQQLYEIQPDNPHNYAHYRYSIDNETLVSELKYVDDASLQMNECVSIGQGEVYGLQHDALHLIFPESDISATLFIHDQPFKTHTDVYKREKMPDKTFSGGEQGKMSLETAIEKLKRLKSLL